MIAKEPKFAITNLRTNAQMQAKKQTDIRTHEHGTHGTRQGPVSPCAKLRFA